MGRTARDNRDMPHPKPVEKIQLSEKHTRLRLALVILLAAVGVGAIVYAVMAHLRVPDGWTAIQVDSSGDVNCSSEFVFQYNLGAGDNSAAEENRKLVSLYTEVSEKAYRIFNADEDFDGIHNLYYINHHPGQEIRVDEVLYHAFEILADHDSRSLYLGPVYEQYNSLFFCQNDSEAANFDPYQNSELKEYVSEIAGYAENPEDIELKLFGDNTVMLSISDGYSQYAKDNQVERFLDFFWMKNAFIIDYFADVMVENGFTRGNFSSYDGFCRNLDESNSSDYSFCLYNRNGNEISSAGTMHYNGPMSIVSLRNYPVNSQDFQHYYEFGDGSIRTPYIDCRDGLCKSSVNNIVCYSEKSGCAEILMQIMPVYIADNLDEQTVPVPEKTDIFSVYFDGDHMICNDPDINIK